RRPVRADRSAAQRGERTAQKTASADQEVLGAGLRRGRTVQERGCDDRRSVAAAAENAAGGQIPGQEPDPSGGSNGLGGRVDALGARAPPQLRLQMDQLGLE